MRRRPRTQYTDTQKALMWERLKKGETLHQIARLFDRPHTSIRQLAREFSLPWAAKLDDATLPTGSKSAWVARSRDGLLVLK